MIDGCHVIIRLLLLVMVSFRLAGCVALPSLSNPPPCALLEIVTPAGGRGQCLWVGNRVLTAAHAFGDGGIDLVPGELRLDGHRAAVISLQMGRLPRGCRSTVVDLVDDWAALEVDVEHRPSSQLRISQRGVVPGERVFLVGYDPAREYSRLVAIPLHVTAGNVVAAHGDRLALPDRVIVAIGPPGQYWDGFSGGFVGRYDPARGEWEYVGQFVWTARGSYTERTITGKVRRQSTEYGAIVRPPEDVLAWLIAGAPEAGADAPVRGASDLRSGPE